MLQPVLRQQASIDLYGYYNITCRYMQVDTLVVNGYMHYKPATCKLSVVI